MAKVNSTVSQMVKAFKTHYKCSEVKTQEISHFLLLFYAVECGLKAKYLRQINSPSTAIFETSPTKFGYSHDLFLLAKELKIPYNDFKDNKHSRIELMHQQLRYGTFTRNQIGNDQIKFLKHLAATLQSTL